MGQVRTGPQSITGKSSLKGAKHEQLLPQRHHQRPQGLRRPRRRLGHVLQRIGRRLGPSVGGLPLVVRYLSSRTPSSIGRSRSPMSNMGATAPPSRSDTRICGRSRFSALSRGESKPVVLTSTCSRSQTTVPVRANITSSGFRLPTPSDVTSTASRLSRARPNTS